MKMNKKKRKNVKKDRSIKKIDKKTHTYTHKYT
jgi:hypothetical protein